MAKSLELPKAGNFGWSLKPLQSAQTSISMIPTGQIEVTIAHDLIKGIRAVMLEWWFRYFTGLQVEKNGVIYPAYYLWHPFDHIGATSDGSVPIAAGNHIHIQEAFQRNLKFVVDENARISVLDTANMGLRVSKLGQTIMDLRHHFEDRTGGVDYRSRMVLGVKSGWLKPLINGLVLPRFFNNEKAQAWLQHNVEEVGCFEHFLADLYERRDQGQLIRLDS